MATRAHKVSVRAQGQVIENWTSYELDFDMLQPVDTFSLQLGPLDAAGEDFGNVWDLCAPDSEVEILVDGVRVMKGLIDEREGACDDQQDVLSIVGRDYTGRMVDESMDLVSFAGLGIEELAKRCAGPWFSAVSLSNAVNRGLITGKARGAKGGKAYKEPDIPRDERRYRKVEPGETRWAVLEYFLRELGLLAWSAADGETLIVGLPNYEQEPTFSLYHPRAGSPRAAEGNVLRLRRKDSVGDRYSRIVAVGANPGDAVNFGARTTKRRGSASNGAGDHGIGKDFQRRKVLLIADDAIKNDTQAQVRADREMAERDAAGLELVASVDGHGQLVSGARRSTLWACDTMVQVESEKLRVKGRYLVTRVSMRGDSENETTELTLVPKGTKLKA